MQRAAGALAIVQPLADANPHDADMAYQTAATLATLSRFDGAATYFDRHREAIAARGPIGAHRVRATIAYRMSDDGRARELFQRLLELDPESYEATFFLGRLHAFDGETEKAAHFEARAKTLREQRDVEDDWQANVTQLARAWRAGRHDECFERVEALLAMPDCAATQALLFRIRSRLHRATGDLLSAELDREQSNRLAADSATRAQLKTDAHAST